MEETIYLQLEDGTLFTGKSFGAPLKDDVLAEVVFTTAMTGYTETLTDPSYYGQMLVQTFPLIGNYGIMPSDFESKKVYMSAYITKEWCQHPSNFRKEMDLDTFLKKEGIPGIYDIDTRALTKKIRQCGVMNGRLTGFPSTKNDTALLSGWSVFHAVDAVTTKAVYQVPCGIADYHVVLWDFGTKENIIRKLHALNCSVTVVPSSCTCEQIMTLKPDGILLSNGPGNPKENTSVISEIAKLCNENIPLFGICLGHQLLSLANGADTEKLKYGHRGANQPVKELLTGKTFITSQNHGYTVKMDTLPPNATVRFINLNDNTCEGINYHSFPGFSVQFHPEACGGPHDTEYLFQEFITNMQRRKLTCP